MNNPGGLFIIMRYSRELFSCEPIEGICLGAFFPPIQKVVNQDYLSCASISFRIGMAFWTASARWLRRFLSFISSSAMV
jgi:hypothetical protein